VDDEIIEVSNINFEFCGVLADNNVATKVVAINKDRRNLDRFKDCPDRYKAVAVTENALESEIISAFEDDEVYNKIVTRTEATLHVCEDKERFCKCNYNIILGLTRTTQIYEVSEELHERLKHLSEEFQAYYIGKEKRRRGKRVVQKESTLQFYLYHDIQSIATQEMC